MTMTNSSLVDYKKLSPNHSGKRTHSINRITPHCVVGQLSVESLGAEFAKKSKEASCNYCIGSDGRIGLIVEEKNRSWCSSSATNDNRAVTIECASDLKSPYAFNDKVYNKLVDLCVDICQRNGKSKLIWISQKDKALSRSLKDDEMLLTVHRWYAAKACPGKWMMQHMDDLADAVTKKLAGESNIPFTISLPEGTKVKASASSKSKTVDTIKKGVYTIVEIKGSYGKLKSGIGWVKL
jgi:hypothetical protein